MTVRCSRCGQKWQRDPALEIPCPSCPAEIGEKCRRPSGHPASIHVDRDRRALEAGVLEPCPAAETSQSDGAEQSSYQTTLSDVYYWVKSGVEAPLTAGFSGPAEGVRGVAIPRVLEH